MWVLVDMMHMWRSEDNMQELVSPTMWGQGIELRSPVLVVSAFTC